MKPTMMHALIFITVMLAGSAIGQDLPKDIAYTGPDGTMIEGVRCATIDSAPTEIPRTPEGWVRVTPPPEGTVYVPIAFHVITSMSGTGSLSEQQLQRQVDTLNTSFDGSGFQFYINSIDTTANDTWFYSTSSNDGSMKAALAIDPTHNLNLYTANIGGGILGYAYLPWQFHESNTLHGVVVLYSSLPGGSAFPYNLGATATHEVGHYLGLYHTFEGGCSGNGDFVDDTPAEASPAFGCPVGRNTCTSPGVDPIHNYMDYTDDICMYEFTTGQAERMDWAVSTYKPGLLEGSVAPNAPANVIAYSDYSTPTSVSLSWSDPTSLNTGDTLLVDYFHVHLYRDGALLDSVAGGTEQYVDSGLLEGNEYEYELFAKLDSSAFPGSSVIVTATAGGSRIPGTPEEFSLSGDLNQVTLSWINPSTNIDNSTMVDFAGIRLYQNDLLVMTYARSSSDTGSVETENFSPSVPGAYAWYLTSIDNEIPQNESPPTSTQITPLNLPALDAFNTAGLPNSAMWTTTNGDVNDRADDPPSPRYSLNLNGMPIGADTVEMRPLDLTGLGTSGIKFAYSHQPAGTGNAPETDDSLWVWFRNDLGAWVEVASYPGTPLEPFVHESIDIATAPNGGGIYFHSQFQVRFTNRGGAGGIPNDDWFIDNIFLGLSAPAISASDVDVVFDTTVVGNSSEFTLYVSNIGLEELQVTGIVLSDPDQFSVDISSFNVAPGEHTLLTLGFSPLMAGTINGTLVVASNDPNQDSLTVSLSGMGDTPVDVNEGKGLPSEFSVAPNYPNPFNPTTTIRYALPVAGEVSLVVYDILGRAVKTLVSGEREAGYHQTSWDGTNNTGQVVGSGVYVYRFVADSYTLTRKMLFIR